MDHAMDDDVDDPAVTLAVEEMLADPDRALLAPESAAEWLMREYSRLMRREAAVREREALAFAPLAAAPSRRRGHRGGRGRAAAPPPPVATNEPPPPSAPAPTMRWADYDETA